MHHRDAGEIAADRRACAAVEQVRNSIAAADEVAGGGDGEVYQREDDKAEVIARRLEVYAEQTAPIISFYRNEGLLISVSAAGSVEDITASAISALSRVAQ